MNIEHKTTPIEHWIVDGKAYRLATEADVGKEVAVTDFSLRCFHGQARTRVLDCVLNEYFRYRANGIPWVYAYVQDDSLLTPQRVPVPALGDGWFLLTAEDGEFQEGDKVRHSHNKNDDGWFSKTITKTPQPIADWLRDNWGAARYFSPTKEPETAIEVQPQPANPIDWTKPVRTKDGRAVRVLCTDGPDDEYPVIGIVNGLLDVSCWALSGQYETGYTGGDDLENIPPEPKRVKKMWWMNVLENGHFYEYSSKDEADSDRTSDILACIPFTIDCVEGEGL